MTVLIEVRNSSGVARRCDAKCYHSTGKICRCVCGGRNHGAGEAQAHFNTTQCYREIQTELGKAGYCNGEVVKMLLLPLPMEGM